MFYFKPPAVYLGVVLSAQALALNLGAIPAFPGAEGAGANAVGGRGGSVYYVTNLNDSGAGSLRTGIGTANRTILFKVSGTIELQSDLKITKSNITVAGQSAPGDGITLKRRLTSVQDCRDVIVRYIRCRAGDADSTFQDDSFHVVNGTNIMVDHVSSSWSVDECLSVTHSTNVTIQWCMISESLNNSQHAKGYHGYGSLLRYGNGALTFHHNLYQQHNSRNPRLGDNLKLDFVNNVLYNWGGTPGYSGDYGDIGDNPGGFTNYLNYVSNYVVAGPISSSANTAFKSGETNTVIYQSGNLIDANKNGVLDGANTGWGMFNGYRYTPAASRYQLPTVSADPGAAAYQRVLAFAGASRIRDEADRRLIGNVRAFTGKLVDAVGASTQATDYVTNNINGTNYVFVRGWPVLNSTTPPTDTDNDGIPNYWEAALGWNPAVANNNHVNTDGYTDLEWYLNWLAALRGLCDRNGSVDLNLPSFVGGYTNLTFTVAAGTNGTVALLGDGFTARFTATNNYSGLADFTFSASNTVDMAGFGPERVKVLVTTTNAPTATNTPPTLAVISNRLIIAGATLMFTNTAGDTDAPPQTLAFSLLNSPTNATINPSNGVFVWRPTIAQGGTSNHLKVVVTDNGSPSLSATQAFSVQVNLPLPPAIQAGMFTGGRFAFTINGDAGPDYTVLATTNLVNWTTVFNTNPPALPFLWTDPDTTSFRERFYRVKLGP